MIRTNTVELTEIPGVAYRQKLASGGSGIVILRADSAQPGIASISKTSGEAIPAKNTPKDLFPKAAFAEAISLTAGMPYKKQGAVKLDGLKKQIPQEEETQAADEAVVDSADYEAIVSAYTDKKGKLSYELLNRDLIRFMHSSSIARAMIAAGEDEERICLYAAGTKFRGITKNHDLSDAQILKIIELLDEVSPKGVLTLFKGEIRRKLAAK